MLTLLYNRKLSLICFYFKYNTTYYRNKSISYPFLPSLEQPHMNFQIPNAYDTTNILTNPTTTKQKSIPAHIPTLHAAVTAIYAPSSRVVMRRPHITI